MGLSIVNTTASAGELERDFKTYIVIEEQRRKMISWGKLLHKDYMTRLLVINKEPRHGGRLGIRVSESIYSVLD